MPVLVRLANGGLVDVDAKTRPFRNREIAVEGRQCILVGAEVQQIVPADIVVDAEADFLDRMTGELFSLIKDHSILSDLLQGPVEPNETFRGAARLAIFEKALPAELFSVRARVLLGQGKKEDAASYASGLLIGTDVGIGLSNPASGRVTVIGRPELTRLYAAAIEEGKREPVEQDGEICFLAGIQEIAKRI